MTIIATAVTNTTTTVAATIAATHLARLLRLAQHAHTEHAIGRHVLLLTEFDAVGELAHVRHAVALLR